MKINCIHCGHRIDLDDAYDEYEGQIKCYVCGNLLEIMTKDGKVKKVRTPAASKVTTTEVSASSKPAKAAATPDRQMKKMP